LGAPRLSNQSNTSNLIAHQRNIIHPNPET
jgi:hypothetical protein